jgi:hypothetical protein
MSFSQLQERYTTLILYHVNKCRVTFRRVFVYMDLQVRSEHKLTLSSVCHVWFRFKDRWYVSDIFFLPTQFEEFLKINFEFYVVSILHEKSYERQ